MTKVKLCGLTCEEDILAANAFMPDYIGFVFTRKSRRYVEPERASGLKKLLDPKIRAAGVFMNEDPEQIVRLLRNGIIDVVQIHGREDNLYIRRLKELSDRPVIQAFQIRNEKDIHVAQRSEADCVLLDSGAGTGTVFEWELVREIRRPYFLAGGLDADNVDTAVKFLHPYGVDVSSGIETGGRKDIRKIEAFVNAVRKED